MLHRLSRKIEQRDNMIYKEKVLERAARRAGRQPNTPENSRAHEVPNKAFEHMVGLLENSELKIQH